MLNSLSSNLAFEDKDITSITVAPGRVDTDMQVQIRSSGQESMDKAQWNTFQDAFEQGKLLKPEQPGNVIAKFVANPQRDLSGQNLKYVQSRFTARMRLTNVDTQLEFARVGFIPGISGGRADICYFLLHHVSLDSVDNMNSFIEIDKICKSVER